MCHHCPLGTTQESASDFFRYCPNVKGIDVAAGLGASHPTIVDESCRLRLATGTIDSAGKRCDVGAATIEALSTSDFCSGATASCGATSSRA